MIDETEKKMDQLGVNLERGQRIAQCRLDAGLTHDELAARTNIAIEVIHSLESGNSASAGNVAELAKTFGVFALWLETGLGEKEVGESRYATVVERPALRTVDAQKLRALLEERHGEPAMLWRDQFALGCWLYHTGHERVARKLVHEVLSTVRAHGNQQYLDAVSEEAARAPLALGISVWPHQELVALLEAAKE